MFLILRAQLIDLCKDECVADFPEPKNININSNLKSGLLPNKSTQYVILEKCRPKNERDCCSL
jgi:hypothetical protein